jgi:hypothetical protein
VEEVLRFLDGGSAPGTGRSSPRRAARPHDGLARACGPRAIGFAPSGVTKVV